MRACKIPDCAAAAEPGSSKCQQHLPKKNPVQLEIIKDKLTLLRHFAGDRERGFHGVEAITTYLRDELGCMRHDGKPVGPNTVRNWIAVADFPSCDIAKRNGTFATNLQILAWLWSRKVWHRMRPYRARKRSEWKPKA